MPQTQTPDRPNIPSHPQPKVFQHIIVLRHPHTEDERDLTIETSSNAFTEVLRELSCQKAIYGLFGYQIYEVLEVDTPF